MQQFLTRSEKMHVFLVESANGFLLLFIRFERCVFIYRYSCHINIEIGKNKCKMLD